MHFYSNSCAIQQEKRQFTLTHKLSITYNTVYDACQMFLCILLLVCVFCSFIRSFVEPFKLLAIYCPHHPEQTVNVNTPAKNERSSSKTNAKKMPYSELNLFMSHYLLYSLCVARSYDIYYIKMQSSTMQSVQCAKMRRARATQCQSYARRVYDKRIFHRTFTLIHSFNRFVSKLDGCHGNHSAFCLFCQNLFPPFVFCRLVCSVAYGFEYTLCVCIYRYANSLFLSLASAGQYTSYAFSKHIFFLAFFGKRNAVVIFSFIPVDL